MQGVEAALERSAGADEQSAAGKGTESLCGTWAQSELDFESLIDRYQDRLFRHALRLLRNAHEAEDVVQEVFVRAFKRRGRLRKVRQIGAYLYRMTSNACLDRIRRQKSSEVALNAPDFQGTPAKQPTPSEVASALEELERVDVLLRELPDTQAEVLRLLVFDELRPTEIALVLKCRVATVRSRLHRGIEKLKQLTRSEREASR